MPLQPGFLVGNERLGTYSSEGGWSGPTTPQRRDKTNFAGVRHGFSRLAVRRKRPENLDSASSAEPSYRPAAPPIVPVDVVGGFRVTTFGTPPGRTYSIAIGSAVANAGAGFESASSRSTTSWRSDAAVPRSTTKIFRRCADHATGKKHAGSFVPACDRERRTVANPDRSTRRNRPKPPGFRPNPGFTLPRPDRFDFERSVKDSVFRLHSPAQLGDDPHRVTEGHLGHDEMRRHAHQGRAHRPDVQVVDLRNPSGGTKALTDGLEREMAGGALGQNFPTPSEKWN